MKRIRHSALERMARALSTAYLDAFMELRPNALAPPTPEWEAVKDATALGWRNVAKHLLAKGTRPPEDHP